MESKQTGHPARWVPTLYLAEALPFSAVMLISIVMYKDYGLSDSQITLYTSYLGLPWVIKPIWSSIVDNMRTKRWWILVTQYLTATALAMVAFTMQIDFWLQASLALFMIIAFSSATHDISADGFYILALNEREQSAYVGIRNTFYRAGMVLGQGGLVMLAGCLTSGCIYISQINFGPFYFTSFPITTAWAIVFIAIALLMACLALMHTKTLPSIEHNVQNKESLKQQLHELWETLLVLARKPHLISALSFILLFRLPEGLLSKMVPLFMKSSHEAGGLGLDNVQIGFINGTLGVIGLLLGGIFGGFLVARFGLKRCLWPLVLCFTLPDIVYLLLSIYTDADIFTIQACVFAEQFGYGMGFAAYTLFLINFSKGERSTAIFSICTAGQFFGGTVLPGMVSGWISDSVGYVGFFTIVMAMCLVTFTVTALAKIKE